MTVFINVSAHLNMPGGVDEEEVEHHVQRTDQQADQAGRQGVAGGTEHGCVHSHGPVSYTHLGHPAELDLTARFALHHLHLVGGHHQVDKHVGLSAPVQSLSLIHISMTFEQVVLLLSLLGGAIYITFQITWTIFNSKKK